MTCHAAPAGRQQNRHLATGKAFVTEYRVQNMGLGDCAASPQLLNSCICAQEPAGTAQSVSMTLVLKNGQQNQSAIAFA